MNEHGRDPRREHRRAGDDSTPTSGRYVLGADGKPLTDRYGRPVLRRDASRPGANQPRANQPRANQPRSNQPRINRGERPRQQFGPTAGQHPPAQAQPTYRTQSDRSAQPQFQQHAQPQYQQPVQPQFQQQPVQQAPAYYTPAPQPQGGGQRSSARRGRPHRHVRKSNPVKSALGCLGFVVVAALVLTLAFALWTDSKLTRIDAFPDLRVEQTRGTNWLLVGSDSRVGLSEEEQMELGTGGDVGAGRTDTIMLLHISPQREAKLVSLPRDSYVNIPGFGMDKINAAFTYGGAPLLVQTVEEWSQLRIDHYAEIGMGGLANVVNSVGGVDICVKEPMNDPLAGIDLQPGCQNLQGRDALGYVRTRATALGDLDRVERQREFFSALLHKVTNPTTLINPFRTVSLVNNTVDSFVVGQRDHVWHLALVALAMADGVETETVPVAGFADTPVGNVVLWDDAGTAALWDSMR
ncbi:LCP family protein [Corynebacterium lizhenjunii]|uniref:LCP family protein n=1 Tax=Corynebacterium lizhenjunii TaxID=2709394 RepID=A0A7T0PB42_9CORY|nr:LCP family protein [Corynebacterium lizhenjunii]QPK79035.1 LCP family protein [Corynebacterium lizhenjunii]